MERFAISLVVTLECLFGKLAPEFVHADADKLVGAFVEALRHLLSHEFENEAFDLRVESGLQGGLVLAVELADGEPAAAALSNQVAELCALARSEMEWPAPASGRTVDAYRGLRHGMDCRGYEDVRVRADEYGYESVDGDNYLAWVEWVDVAVDYLALVAEERPESLDAVARELGAASFDAWDEAQGWGEDWDLDLQNRQRFLGAASRLWA